jgi:hypothetical protein
LAIGLFSIAMIIIFGYRRIQFGRGFTVGGIPTPEMEGDMIRIVLNRPKLWDLWNGDNVNWSQVAGNEKGAHDAQLQWANIMPLTANAVSTVIPESNNPSPEPPRPSLRRDLLNPRLRLFSVWTRAWRRPKHHENESDAPLDIPPSTLQVGVAILMPSPRHPVYVKEPKDNEYHEHERRRERNEITDYSIGMYECSWDS